MWPQFCDLYMLIPTFRISNLDLQLELQMVWTLNNDNQNWHWSQRIILCIFEMIRHGCNHCYRWRHKTVVVRMWQPKPHHWLKGLDEAWQSLSTQCVFQNSNVFSPKHNVFDEDDDLWWNRFVCVCGGGVMGDSGSQDLIFPDFTSFIGTLRRL